MELTPTWTFNGKKLIDPAELAKSRLGDNAPVDDFWGKANSFTLTRGRHPSRGFILVPGIDLDSIRQTAHRPLHTLTISDGSRSITLNNLVVCSWSDVSPSRSPNQSVFLLELSDSRHYAQWTVADRLFNGLNLDGTLHPSATKSFTDTIRDLWSDLSPLLGPLTISVALPAEIPETVGYMGSPGFESFCNWIEKLGLIITPNDVGYTLTRPTATPTQPDIYKAAKDRFLIDTEDSLPFSAVPATIRVFHYARDYQYYKSDNATAADHWTFNPRQHFDYATTRLDRNLGNRVVPNTILPVWAPYAYRTDDKGRVLDEDSLKRKSERFALLVLQGLTDREAIKSETFSGLHQLRPGSYFSGVSFYDHGEGLKTRAFVEPSSLNPYTLYNRGNGGSRDSSPADESLTPPSLVRATIPYERIAHGTVMPLNEADLNIPCSIRSPLTPPTPAQLRSALQPNAAAWVHIQHFVINDKTQTVHHSTRVLAYNATGQPIPYRSTVTIRFHLQAGEGGEWEIFATLGAHPDWQADCIPYGIARETPCVRSPNLITVRKNSGLRLASRSPERNGIREAIIDFVGGPPNYVMVGRGIDQPPYWQGDLRTAGTISANRWLKIRGTNPGVPGETGAWIGPPSHGLTKIKLPARDGLRPNSFLVAGNASSCIPLKWFGPGISLSVSFSGRSGKGSCLPAKCVSLTFKHGLLVSQTGLQLDYTQDPLLQADCSDPRLPDFAHCETLPPPPTSPGEPQEPPPQEPPPQRPPILPCPDVVPWPVRELPECDRGQPPPTCTDPGGGMNQNPDNPDPAPRCP